MKLGLALSGGAAYGLANIGILETLHEKGVRPDCISGSSMGAIVGAIYALHGTTEYFKPLIVQLNMLSIARLSDAPLKNGLHGGIFQQKLREHLSGIFKDATIGDCAIPFVCVAAKVHKPINWTHIISQDFTDEVLASTSLHIFPKDTPLLDALMASSAIPVLFSPVTIDGEEFVDLVHFGAVPARTLRNECKPDVVIGTDTNPRYDELMHYLPTGWKTFLERGYEELDRSLEACNVVLSPTLKGGPLRFDKAEEFIEEGRHITEETWETLQHIV